MQGQDVVLLVVMGYEMGDIFWLLNLYLSYIRSTLHEYLMVVHLYLLGVHLNVHLQLLSLYGRSQVDSKT